MKLKIIGVLIILFLGSFTNESEEISIRASLVNIKFYSKCNCDEKSPVLVRVTYSVKGNKYKNLKMIHDYGDGIKTTVKVTEKDKTGNVVYNFCSQEGKELNFKTEFLTTKGDKSNTVDVKIHVNPDSIIEGTAPATIKVN